MKSIKLMVLVTMIAALGFASFANAQNPRTLPEDTSPAVADIMTIWKDSPTVTKHITLDTLRDFIAVPTRSTAIADDAIDDAATIQAEIDALSADGGIIDLPCGDVRINTMLTIGNGSAGVQSTKHNVYLRGCGETANYLTGMTVGGTSGTRILWYGAAGGTMIKFAGPISGGGLLDLTLDGAATANVAATLVEAFHHLRPRYEDLNLQGYSGIGFRINSTETFSGVVIGADEGIWQNVKVNSPTTTTAVAMDIGSSTWSATQMSVSRNLFLDVILRGGSGATGRALVLRFCDNNTFVRPLLQAGTNPLEIAPPTGAENFPMAITFYDAVIMGGMTVTGSWTSTTGVRGLLFWPWITTDGGSPPVHAKVRGIDDQGGFFGAYTGDPVAGYALLAGRAGNQVLRGGTAASEILELRGTSHATPGTVQVEDSTFVFNEGGADRDFRVESDGDANMLFVDGGTNRVGIGTATPEAVGLHIYSAETGDACLALGPNPDGSPGTVSAFNLCYGGASFSEGAAFINVRPTTAAGTNDPSFRIYTNNVERVRFAGGGDTIWKLVTTTPSAALTDSVRTWVCDSAPGDANLCSLNEAGISERLTGLRKRVKTQFDKTSDTTLANVTDLTFNVEAGKSYGFSATLFTTSNVAGGIKAAIGGTATATAIIYEGEIHDGGLTKARGTAFGAEVCTITAATTVSCYLRGTITVNAAGTLTVQFAQNVSNGSASSVLVGSQFYLEPIGN